jgi:hypothetical protein
MTGSGSAKRCAGCPQVFPSGSAMDEIEQRGKSVAKRARLLERFGVQADAPKPGAWLRLGGVGRPRSWR